MDLLLVLIAITTFPVACLAFVLWMGLLEDSIPDGVRRAVREPDPEPITSVPVRGPAVAGWTGLVAATAAPAGIPGPRSRPGGDSARSGPPSLRPSVRA